MPSNEIDEAVALVFDPSTNSFVLHKLDAEPVRYRIYSAPLGPIGTVLTSVWQDRDEPYPGRSFTSLRTLITSNGSFTAKIQQSDDKSSIVEASMIVTQTGNVWSVDSTVSALTKRFSRWVFTSSSNSMTSFEAKAVLL